jgi:trans-AT polyketide synthase/acyltransferase/oxidoreductase domain-containing protein
MITYVFPGQGVQKKGMGAEVFNEFPELTAIADQVLGYSIENICLEDPEGKLSLTQYTQPAIFIVNAFMYLKKCKESGVTPDFVAGHSLGEYNALFAAGAFDFETGVKLVKKRGELMAQATGGGMAAVIGLTGEEVRSVLEEKNLNKIDIANYNSPYQVVIAGPKEEVVNAKSIFEEIEKVRMVSLLNVSGAFHSRYMEEASIEFGKMIDRISFSEIKIPVIANVSARTYKQADIKKNLILQINHSVQWVDSVRYLMGRGEMTFEEVGAGRVLTGMIKKIQSEATPLIVTEEDERTSVSRNEVKFLPDTLGSEAFRNRYHLKYAYIAGAMYRGVSSKELVVKAGNSGMLAFYGSGGLKLETIEKDLQYIQRELSGGGAYGCNFLHNSNHPEKEEALAMLLIKNRIPVIEASAFLGITPGLILYKAAGLVEDSFGKMKSLNRIIAKVSRPEVAEAFLSPAPERMVKKLLDEGKITMKQAQELEKIPMADDICIESDSGGHTDRGVAFALIPSVRRVRDKMVEKFNYTEKISIGAAGGIGTPEAAAASFVLGADFIVTGSINQCSVEAGTSDVVKDILAQMNVQDTEYSPAGDMFEYGAKVQVLKKGVFFPARANKLYDLYIHNNSIDEIDEKTKKQIQEKYLKRSFESVFEELKQHYDTSIIMKAESNPKYKMALIFKWYFYYANQLAVSGNTESKVDYQVYTGPALGAFNQWILDSEYKEWRKRHVDDIGKMLLEATADYLNGFYK